MWRTLLKGTEKCVKKSLVLKDMERFYNIVRAFDSACSITKQTFID